MMLVEGEARDRRTEGAISIERFEKDPFFFLSKEDKDQGRSGGRKKNWKKENSRTVDIGSLDVSSAKDFYLRFINQVCM